MGKSERVIGVDVAKIVAMIFVVAVHTNNIGLPFGASETYCKGVWVYMDAHTVVLQQGQRVSSGVALFGFGRIVRTGARDCPCWSMGVEEA